MRNILLLRFCVVLIIFIFLSGCTPTPFSFEGSKEATITMVVTAYCPCGKCCGWERNWLGIPVFSDGPLKGERKKVGITSSGAKARIGTIAADTSKYPYGTKMYVPGYGWGKVQDTGSAIKGNRIDVFFPSHQQALNWGRRSLQVKVIWE